MIEGFPKETHDLTPYELDTLVPLFVQGFEPRIGKKKAITNEKIRASMAKMGIKVADPRVRAIIHYIRVENLVPYLVAGKAGYWIEYDADLRANWMLSVAQRIRSMQEILDAARYYKRLESDKPDSIDQLDMFNQN